MSAYLCATRIDYCLYSNVCPGPSIQIPPRAPRSTAGIGKFEISDDLYNLSITSFKSFDLILPYETNNTLVFWWIGFANINFNNIRLVFE